MKRAEANLDIRRRWSPHRAGRRAGAHRRGRSAVPGVDLNGSATRSRSSQSERRRSSSPVYHPEDLSKTPVRPPSPPVTKSTSGARTGRRCAWSEQTAVASRYDREVVGLTTVVATANAYFQVLARKDRLRVAREKYRQR